MHTLMILLDCEKSLRSVFLYIVDDNTGIFRVLSSSVAFAYALPIIMISLFQYIFLSFPQFFS